MITEIDEGKGLVKTYWENVRTRVAKVEPAFAKIVDDLNPGKDFPLYLAYYPYGATIGDTEQPFFPKSDGSVFSLNDTDVPQELVKHLGYGIDSIPMGMLLEKELEFFIDLHDNKLTIPWAIHKPGSFFPFSRILKNANSRLYSPNGVRTMVSGVRSCLMLPHIGSTEPHACLQREYNIKSSVPKTLYEHWFVFRELANSPSIKEPWHACILFFCEKWLEMLHNDKAWLPLKLHLHELGWQKFEYGRAHASYDIIFSTIQKKRNLKPSPYLADTARHLFATALGVVPGYMPAWNDDALPLHHLQQAYVNCYRLYNHHPVIMQPAHFNFGHDNYPIFYSLQYPSTYAFSPKSEKGASTLSELRDLDHIINIYMEELAGKHTMCAGTALSMVAKSVEFNYYHNKPDRHQIVRPTIDIATIDKRLHILNGDRRLANATFPVDAPFVRGCIAINSKQYD
jgi:hypothetical protein